MPLAPCRRPLAGDAETDAANSKVRLPYHSIEKPRASGSRARRIKKSRAAACIFLRIPAEYSVWSGRTAREPCGSQFPDETAPHLRGTVLFRTAERIPRPLDFPFAPAPPSSQRIRATETAATSTRVGPGFPG